MKKKQKQVNNSKRLAATALSLSLVIGGGVSAFANTASNIEVPVISVNSGLIV